MFTQPANDSFNMNSDWKRRTHSVDHSEVLFTITVLFNLCSFIANSAIILVFLKYNLLKTSTNVYIAISAVSGLLLSILDGVFYSSRLFLNHKDSKVYTSLLPRNISCVVETFLEPILGYSIVISLMFVAFQRVLAIRRASRFTRTIVASTVWLTVGATVVVITAVCLAPLYGWETVTTETGGRSVGVKNIERIVKSIEETTISGGFQGVEVEINTEDINSHFTDAENRSTTQHQKHSHHANLIASNLSNRHSFICLMEFYQNTHYSIFYACTRGVLLFLVPFLIMFMCYYFVYCTVVNTHAHRMSKIKNAHHHMQQSRELIDPKCSTTSLPAHPEKNQTVAKSHRMKQIKEDDKQQLSGQTLDKKAPLEQQAKKITNNQTDNQINKQIGTPDLSEKRFRLNSSIKLTSSSKRSIVSKKSRTNARMVRTVAVVLATFFILLMIFECYSIYFSVLPHSLDNMKLHVFVYHVVWILWKSTVQFMPISQVLLNTHFRQHLLFVCCRHGNINMGEVSDTFFYPLKYQVTAVGKTHMNDTPHLGLQKPLQQRRRNVSISSNRQSLENGRNSKYNESDRTDNHIARGNKFTDIVEDIPDLLCTVDKSTPPVRHQIRVYGKRRIEQVSSDLNVSAKTTQHNEQTNNTQQTTQNATRSQDAMNQAQRTDAHNEQLHQHATQIQDNTSDTKPDLLSVNPQLAQNKHTGYNPDISDIDANAAASNQQGDTSNTPNCTKEDNELTLDGTQYSDATSTGERHIEFDDKCHYYKNQAERHSSIASDDAHDSDDQHSSSCEQLEQHKLGTSNKLHPPIYLEQISEAPSDISQTTDTSRLTPTCPEDENCPQNDDASAETNSVSYDSKL